jgi:hypothetical protein
MRTLATAVLALFMTTAALAVADGTWQNPDRLAGLAGTVKIAGAPAALYLAYFARGWMALRARDRIAREALIVEAHVMALGLTGLALALVLTLVWIYSDYKTDLVLETLPKGIAAAAAGGFGLAWGALWRLPGQEEAE